MITVAPPPPSAEHLPYRYRRNRPLSTAEQAQLYAIAEITTFLITGELIYTDRPLPPRVVAQLRLALIVREVA